VTSSQHHWQVDGIAPLTYDEFLAGETCRACNEPLVDDRGNTPAILHMTDEQRPFWDVEDARYDAAHSDCRAGRWTVAPGGPTHCMNCCPPPPMSPATIDKVARLLRRHP
jgi:hypothetical protein